jgi:hypothetical protein
MLATEVLKESDHDVANVALQMLGNSRSRSAINSDEPIAKE